MIPAAIAVQRPASARLLVLDARRGISELPRASLAALFRSGDLVVANDAATLPASLHGTHLRSQAPLEVRLASWRGLDQVFEFDAIVFGEGDHHTRTEDRALPPQMQPGDVLRLGPLMATVLSCDHPRLVALRFEGAAEVIWAGLASAGRPIQYAHLEDPLALWDVWTPIAGPPVAFEPPSAGFALHWKLLGELRAGGVGFATLTHAAGISSTGDPELDRRLPFDEPYLIPSATVLAIEHARRIGGRVIAIGTTVVRALEHAAAESGGLRAGAGLATQRIDLRTHLRVCDAILSGTHEPGTSHHALLRAFTDETSLRRIDEALLERGYLTHEFGDSVLIERTRDRSDALPFTPLPR